MSATRWSYYTTSEDAWNAMYEVCAAAERSIDFEQYIFRTRKIGRKFLKLFEEKARQGVEIRLLCDMIGSITLYFSFERWRLKRRGVSLMFYNPVRPWKLFCSCGLFPRDHRKIMVVDQKVAFTGGVCIDEDMRHWRDTHVKLEGEVVKEIQFTFDSIWKSTKEEGCRAASKAYDSDLENTIYLNEPTQHAPVLREKILSRLRYAKTRVYVTTPYFVPAKRFTRRICRLVRKGVDVRIITSGHSNPFSRWLGRAEAGRFLQHGARYYSYEKTMHHAKTLLIDDDFVAIGSFNVDNLSFYHNQEADVISHDPEVVATLRQHFEEDLRHCREFTLKEWETRSWYERLACFSMTPIKRYL